MKKKTKIELASAIIIAVALSLLTAYINRPKRTEYLVGGFRLSSRESSEELSKYWGFGGSSEVKVVTENINGELRQGSFETVVQGLKNLTSQHSGKVSYLNMIYENDRWSGILRCNVPTENVHSFTFDVKKLINNNGKVTRIIITESLSYSTQPEKQLSEVSINLKELAEGESQIINQIVTVVPWLVTSLIWIAQGLIIGVPLCFASLGVVLIIDRGIIPVWKKQFKDRSLSKTKT